MRKPRKETIKEVTFRIKTNATHKEIRETLEAGLMRELCFDLEALGRRVAPYAKAKVTDVGER